LSNLTAAYRHPCVMDIKLGQKNWVDDDLESRGPEYIRKRRVMMNATTAAELGFRISGIRVYRPVFDNYLIRKSIHSTRMLSHLDGSLEEAILSYLNDGVCVRTSLITHFINKLDSLCHALNSQNKFDFMASSILLIYEGCPEQKLEQMGITPRERNVDVRLIDFDHTYILNQLDEWEDSGVALGVESLARMFRKLSMTQNQRRSEISLQYNPNSGKKNDVDEKRPRSHSTST